MQLVIKDKNGNVINIGPWDYKMAPVIENGEQVGEVPTNPLPDGAYEDQADVIEGVDGGKYAAADYRALRRNAYPSIGDQLDALYHAGLMPADMAAKLAAVKAEYPKPGQ